MDKNSLVILLIKNNLKLINKLCFAILSLSLSLFSYLRSFRESEYKFQIFFLYWSYFLLYPIFWCDTYFVYWILYSASYVYFLSRMFYIYLCTISHSLLLFIHFKSYILDAFLVHKDYV